MDLILIIIGFLVLYLIIRTSVKNGIIDAYLEIEEIKKNKSDNF